MRPKASQSAKDFLIELPERDISRVMKKPLAQGRETSLSGTNALRRAEALAGWGPTTGRLTEKGDL